MGNIKVQRHERYRDEFQHKIIKRMGKDNTCREMNRTFSRIKGLTILDSGNGSNPKLDKNIVSVADPNEPIQKLLELII